MEGSLDAFDPIGEPPPDRRTLLEGSAIADQAIQAGAIASDPRGNLYLIAYDYGGLGGSLLVKLLPDGTELWRHWFDDSEMPWGIAADGSGVYVAGGTTGALRRQDGFVASFDEDGALSWRKTLGTEDFDRAGAIAVDGDGVYVGGESGGRSGPATVWKVDHEGEVLWTGSIDLGNLGFNAVATDGGTVYVGGQDGGDALLAAFDTSGAHPWTRRWGTKREDWVAGIVVEGGRVFAAGTRGLRYEEISGGGSRVAAGKGFVTAFDADGSRLRTTLISNAGAVVVNAVAAGADVLYLVGYTDGVFPGHTSTGGHDGSWPRWRSSEANRSRGDSDDGAVGTHGASFGVIGRRSGPDQGCGHGSDASPPPTNHVVRFGRAYPLTVHSIKDVNRGHFLIHPVRTRDVPNAAEDVRIGHRRNLCERIAGRVTTRKPRDGCLVPAV